MLEDGLWNLENVVTPQAMPGDEKCGHFRLTRYSPDTPTVHVAIKAVVQSWSMFKMTQFPLRKWVCCALWIVVNQRFLSRWRRTYLKLAGCSWEWLNNLQMRTCSFLSDNYRSMKWVSLEKWIKWIKASYLWRSYYLKRAWCPFSTRRRKQVTEYLDQSKLRDLRRGRRLTTRVLWKHEKCRLLESLGNVYSQVNAG